MRKKLWLLACLALLSCDKDKDENINLGDFGKQVCEDDICVDNIKEIEGGFLVSPIDIDKTGEDSQGNMISSNTVLVRFNNEARIKEIVENVRGKISAFIPGVNIYEIRFDFDSTEMVEIKIYELMSYGEVDLVEKNFVFELEDLDIEDSELKGTYVWNGAWGFEAIKLAEAYDFIEENNIELHPVKVAVLDSGFDLDHKELSGLYIANTYDLADADKSVFPDKNKKGEINYHGTQTAGIILAQNGNDGINGVAFNAQLLAYKVVPSKENQEWTIERAIIQGIELAVEDGASVVSISLGTDSAEDFESLDFLLEAMRSDVIIVASAGNDGDDARHHYPSAFPGVISVGAIDSDGARAEFSNYSKDNDENILTLAAPGDKLLLLGPNNSYQYIPEGEGITSGTSFSAPFVAGLAALLKSIKPDLTAGEVRQIMIDSADTIFVLYPDGSAHVWKRINAKKAVEMAHGLEQMSVDILGKACKTHSDCGLNGFCDDDFCKIYCLNEDDMPNSNCDEVNCYNSCPSGARCHEWKTLLMAVYRRCFTLCDNNVDCNSDHETYCWQSKYGDKGLCVPYWYTLDSVEYDTCGELLEGFDNFDCEQDLMCDVSVLGNYGYCVEICDPYYPNCSEGKSCSSFIIEDHYGNIHCGECLIRHGEVALGEVCEDVRDCPLDSTCIAPRGEIHRCRQYCDVRNPWCPNNYYCAEIVENCGGVNSGVCEPY